MSWSFSPQTLSEVLEEITLRSHACALVKKHEQSELYSVEDFMLDGNLVRRIVVFLLAEEDAGWGCKAIEEAQGPCYYDCPLELIDLCDPPTNAWAERWRHKVRTQAGAKLAA